MSRSHDVEELAFVIELATEAAAIARERAEQVTPTEKANASYVTDLDHDLETLIRKRLGERFPDDRLTGEEQPAGGGQGPRLWSIDPIDGTGNLVHGLPMWAISIGLVDRGEPVLGVIAVPPQNEMFWATRGGGAFKDGEPITCAADAPAFHPQDNVCVGTNAIRLIDCRTVPGRLRAIGSLCCELVYTAMGRIVASAYLGGQLHDVAAGTVIAHEAGCRIGTLGGRVLTPAEFLAATPIRETTFVAPPRRLEALMHGVRPLPPRSPEAAAR